MKKNLLAVLMTFFIWHFSSFIIAQTIIYSQDFNTYDGTVPNTPAGWYIGNHDFYSTTFINGVSGPNAFKFSINADTIQSPSFANADSVSFWIKGAGTDTISSINIYQTSDNINWTLIAGYDHLPTIGTVINLPVSNTSVRLMFIYLKSVGNLAFDDFAITQNIPLSTLQIQSGSQTNDLIIFPNPTSGIFKLKEIYSNVLSLRVVDIFGKVIHVANSENSGAENTFFDLSFLPSGYYFLSLDGEVNSLRKLCIVK